MAFNKAVLLEHNDLPAGEVIKDSPHNISAFDVFEDGLVIGRFARFDAGSVKNLDGSATPKIIGIPRRKVSGELGNNFYSTGGTEIDSVAEVINFGFATVEVPGGVAPARYEPVYAVNAAGADIGKGTNVAADNVEVANTVFWEAKAANVWLVRVGAFL